MELKDFDPLLNIMLSVGTFLTGIAAVIGIIKYIGSLAVKNETLYGDEAVERFNLLEDKLRRKPTLALKSLGAF